MASNNDSAAARDALSGLGDDRARLANRVITPWWYHPIYAVILVVLVCSQALPGVWSLPVILGAVVALTVLRTTYDRKYGISIDKPQGALTRTLLAAVIVILVASMIAVRVMQQTATSLWWILVPSAVTAAAAVALGRCYDAALRRELAGRT